MINLFRKKKKKFPRIFSYIFGFLILFLFIFFSFYIYFEINYKGRILPNVYIGTLDVSGKTAEEARKMVNQRIDIFNLEGIVFKNSERVYIYPIESSPDGEILNYLVFFDIEEAVNKSVLIGNSGNFLSDYLEKVNLVLFHRNKVNYVTARADHEKILKRLEEKLSSYKYHNAFYYIDESGELKIQKEVIGKDFTYNFDSLERNLKSLNSSENMLLITDHKPEVIESDCLKKKNELENLLIYSPIYLASGGEYWVIDKKELVSWIKLAKNENGFSFKIDKDRLSDYIKENVSSVLDIPPEMPKFNIEEGKLKDFTPGKNGLGVDIDQMAEDLNSFFIGQNYFEIKMKDVRPLIDLGKNDTDLTGIKEVIGEYSLSFAGSSASRIKNVTNGASKISGAIIKPGEEFSTVKFLSPIEVSNGYAKEAVINGGTITHEVGGGLCQLSTTLFRTILNTGLPITMRTNHTYDMSYYFPIGVDAAIYDPAPDLRFVNDTGNNILVVAWVEKVVLNIQIWGTNDGRIVKRTNPIRYNIVKPGAAKIIPSSNLATGVTQCSYAAYVGSDTYFDYIVTYSDGTVKEERFKSHYVPRRGICYVGI